MRSSRARKLASVRRRFLERKKLSSRLINFDGAAGPWTRGVIITAVTFCTGNMWSCANDRDKCRASFVARGARPKQQTWSPHVFQFHFSFSFYFAKSIEKVNKWSYAQQLPASHQTSCHPQFGAKIMCSMFEIISEFSSVIISQGSYCRCRTRSGAVSLLACWLVFVKRVNFSFSLVQRK